MNQGKNQPGKVSDINLSTQKLNKAFDRAEAKLRSDKKAKPIITQALEALRKQVSKEARTSECFENLVADGCDRQELLWRLAACSEDPDPDSTDELTGFDNRQLKAFAEQLQTTAQRIEAIHTAKVSKIFEEANISELFSLPDSLMDFGMLLSFVGKLRWRTYWVIAKNQLIDYIFKIVGEYRDKEVAELIAVATHNYRYTEHDHGEWRRRNHQPHPAARETIVNTRVSRKAEAMIQSVFFMCEYVLFVKLQRSNPESASVSSPS